MSGTKSEAHLRDAGKLLAEDDEIVKLAGVAARVCALGCDRFGHADKCRRQSNFRGLSFEMIEKNVGTRALLQGG
ncbi:MAG: hypothetical protein QE272_12040 [Nevskia sp.]|nr:hypothetical protein [Nevskia sp.]